VKLTNPTVFIWNGLLKLDSLSYAYLWPQAYHHPTLWSFIENHEHLADKLLGDYEVWIDWKG